MTARAPNKDLVATGLVVTSFSDPPDRLLRLAEVSRRVGIGKTMIYDLIGRDRFPAPYKVSPKASRWSEAEIVAWIAEIKHGFEGKQRKFW